MSVEALAASTTASKRGLRILCDYLTVIGLLEKQGPNYALAQVARTFLDETAPLAMGRIVDFVAAPEILDMFLSDPVSYVRRGGSSGLANLSPDHPVWVRFAKAAAPFAATTAKRVAATSQPSPICPTPYLILLRGTAYLASRWRKYRQRHSLQQWIGRRYWPSPKPTPRWPEWPIDLVCSRATH